MATEENGNGFRTHHYNLAKAIATIKQRLNVLEEDNEVLMSLVPFQKFMEAKRLVRKKNRILDKIEREANEYAAVVKQIEDASSE
jgi:hypothetical protein